MERGISGTPGAAIVVPFTNREPGAPRGPRPPSFFHWRDFKDWVVSMVNKFTVDLTTKADKVPGGTAGNLASIGADGNIVDSGIQSFTFDTTPTAGSLNPVTSDGIKQAIEDAKPSDYEQVKAQVSQNAEDIDAIEGKIPSQASAENQLADKAFVNSSIATNTAFYISDRGSPFQSLADLENYEGALTNNDYAFVVGQDSEGNTTYTRYKWNEATETWGEEYVLNNSSFTAAQWEAISSGITSALVTKLGALPTAEQLAASLLAKYEKPSTGIPKTDLASGVQTSLDKADTAFQKPSAGIPKIDLSESVQASLGKADTALQSAPVTSVNTKAGAVVLSASDIGALPNSGNLMLDGSINASNFLAAGQLIVGTSSNGLIFSQDDSFVYATVKVGGSTISTYKFPKDSDWAGDNGNIARLLDIYAAVQQIAPDFTAKAYALNELCTYNGVVYRCKSAYTATAQSTKPNSDTTHWEAKKVSELFLSLTGGTMTGNLEFRDLSGYRHVWKFENGIGGDLSLDTYNSSNVKTGSISIPAYVTDTLALVSQIYAAVQQIAPAWVNGTAYTVNALVSYNGVVYRCKTDTVFPHTAKPNTDTTHWEAKKVSELFLPLTGGEISGDLLIDGKINLSAFFSIEKWMSSGLVFTGNIYNTQRRALLSLRNASSSAPISVIAFLQNLAPDYDATATYALNDLCVYGGALYRCTTAITTAEAWTAAHWTEATVEDVLAVIRSALDDKAPLASPAFTGTPTAPTPTSGDDSTKVATTAFVQAAVAGATPNLDYVMRVNPETGEIYYTTPDANA